MPICAENSRSLRSKDILFITLLSVVSRVGFVLFLFGHHVCNTSSLPSVVKLALRVYYTIYTSRAFFRNKRTKCFEQFLRVCSASMVCFLFLLMSSNPLRFSFCFSFARDNQSKRPFGDPSCKVVRKPFLHPQCLIIVALTSILRIVNETRNLYSFLVIFIPQNYKQSLSFISTTNISSPKEHTFSLFASLHTFFE